MFITRTNIHSNRKINDSNKHIRFITSTMQIHNRVTTTHLLSNSTQLGVPTRLTKLHLNRMSTNLQLFRATKGRTHSIHIRSLNLCRHHRLLLLHRPRLRVTIHKHLPRHLRRQQRHQHTHTQRRINRSHLQHLINMNILLLMSQIIRMRLIRRRLSHIHTIRRLTIARLSQSHHTSRQLRRRKIGHRRTNSLLILITQLHRPRILRYSHDPLRIQISNNHL